MDTKLFNMGLIKYEMKNIRGNIFTLIFGVVFPIFFSIFLSKMFGAKVPVEARSQVITNIYITCSIIIPLAVILMGYSCTFSNELEKDIPLRFKLFGFNEKKMLFSKICAYLIFMTIVLVIYTIIDFSILNIQIPSVSSALIFIVSLYLLATTLFVLSHGIALFFKKFGPTYAVTMTLYFGIMVLSGMFGVQAKDFPKPMRVVADLFPTTYMSSEFVEFWQGGSYNFVPFIQSFVFFMAISGIVLFFAMNYNSRKVK